MTNRHESSAGRRGPSDRATILLEECRTPFGTIHLAATGQGLCRITVPGEELMDLLAWIERRLPSADVLQASGALDSAVSALCQFFDGVPLPPMPIDLIGTVFQQAVWNAVLAIPYGETRSYADIARSIGHPLAGRAVGSANAANPLPFVVPCHRVIGADGTIKGYPGGIITRRMLLELEGVRLG